MVRQFHVGRVVEPHVPAAPSRLKLHAGDVVRVEEDLSHEPGWVQCRDMSGEVGRVPKAFLSIECDSAILRRDYEDTQLAIRNGRVIILGEESGWLWCVDRRKTYGWLPKKKVKLLE